MFVFLGIAQEAKNMYLDLFAETETIPDTAEEYFHMCTCVEVLCDKTATQFHFAILLSMQREYHAGSKSTLASLAFKLHKVPLFEFAIGKILGNFEVLPWTPHPSTAGQ